MKTTIDIPDVIYRKLKAKSAIEGRPVRDVAITLFSAWVDQNYEPRSRSKQRTSKVKSQPEPLWFASLRKYARNAGGRYDMDAVRRSIARGRAGKCRRL